MAVHVKQNGARHRVRYGLGTGTSDLIGWTTVKVTHAMVGHDVAVFTAIEGKRGSDSLSNEQVAFLSAVNKAGGVSFTYSSPENAEEHLKAGMDSILGR